MQISVFAASVFSPLNRIRMFRYETGNIRGPDHFMIIIVNSFVILFTSNAIAKKILIKMQADKLFQKNFRK